MVENNYNWPLRMAIKANGYNYKTLAKKSGLHHVKICRLVLGKSVPKQSERAVLSRILRKPQKILFREYV